MQASKMSKPAGGGGKGGKRKGKGKGGDDNEGGDEELSKSSSTGLTESVEVTKKFWGNSKALTFRASVSSTSYTPGYEIVLEVGMNNPSGKKVKNFKVGLEKVEAGAKLKKQKANLLGKMAPYKDVVIGMNGNPTEFEVQHAHDILPCYPATQT